MLQRTSLPTTANTAIAQTLQRTWERSWLRSLQETVQLPETWQQYMFMLIAATLVAVALAWQVFLGVQIAEARHQLRLLRVDYEVIERQNSELVYQIATHSNLRRVQQLAKEQGFGPATSRVYVARPAPGTAPGANAALTLRANSGASTPATGTAGSWFDQAQQWLGKGQAAAQATMSQLVRDVTGRMR